MIGADAPPEQTAAAVAGTGVYHRGCLGTNEVTDMGILTGLVDRAVLVAAFIGGATVPSFVAQYRQRLGGALDQAAAVVRAAFVPDQGRAGAVAPAAGDRAERAGLARAADAAAVAGRALRRLGRRLGVELDDLVHAPIFGVRRRRRSFDEAGAAPSIAPAPAPAPPPSPSPSPSPPERADPSDWRAT